MDKLNNQKVTIVNTEIDNLKFSEAVSLINRWAKEKSSPKYVVTPNTDHIVRLQSDMEFQEIYKNADLVLVDGMPLIWAARFLGVPFYEKISGSDLFPAICKDAAGKDIRLFFLGGNPGDAELAAEKLVQENPGLQIAGTYCPPFGFEKDQEESEKIIEAITNAKPDILFVGLGSPKQEKWMYQNCRKLDVSVSIGIGVSFSFIAGTIKRAPVIMQKTGTEWFWRLMQEPGRLWKRYLVDDMKYFWLVLKQKIAFRASRESGN